MTAASNEIHGTSRIVIHDGKLEEFKRLAAQGVEIVRTKDTGTLEYDHFLNADGTECFVHERYRDSAAGLEHMVNIAPMFEPLSKVCTITGEVCGTAAPRAQNYEKPSKPPASRSTPHSPSETRSASARVAGQT